MIELSKVIVLINQIVLEISINGFQAPLKRTFKDFTDLINGRVKWPITVLHDGWFKN